MIIECTKDGFELIEKSSYLPPLNKQIKKKYKWIFLSEISARCSICYRKNVLYGDYCKYCGEKMVGDD